MSILNELEELLGSSYFNEELENKFIGSLLESDSDFITSLIESLEELLEAEEKKEKTTPKIKLKNKGLLQIPQGQKFYNLSVEHYVSLAKQLGYRPVSRALVALMVFNKNKNKTVSDKALDILNKLRLQVQADRKEDKHHYRELGSSTPVKDGKRVVGSQVSRVLDQLHSENKISHEFKNGTIISRTGNNEYVIDDGTDSPDLNKVFTRKDAENFIKRNSDILNNETQEYMDNMQQAYGDEYKNKPRVFRKYKTGVGTQSDKIKVTNVFRDLTDKEQVSLSSGGNLVKVGKNNYVLSDVEDDALDGQYGRSDILTKKDVEYLIRNNPNEFDGYRTA